MQINVEVEGFEELAAALGRKKALDYVKQVVRHHGGKLNERMVQNANFTRGYATGTTKRSIHMSMRGDLTAVVGPSTEYSPYLEWGTRFMSAQPFVGPSFNAQKSLFIADLKKIMK